MCENWVWIRCRLSVRVGAGKNACKIIGGTGEVGGAKVSRSCTPRSLGKAYRTGICGKKFAGARQTGTPTAEKLNYYLNDGVVVPLTGIF